MANFVMLGKYSSGSLKGISAKRTKQALALIEKCGGKVEGVYALLGEHDLLLVVSYPGTLEALRGSLAVAKLTGISFSTLPAFTVADLDRAAASED